MRLSVPLVTARTAASAVTSAAIAVAGLAGCESRPPGDLPAAHQVLSAEVDGGESDIAAPSPNHGYWATFGAYMVCSKKAGVTPTLAGVHFVYGRPAPVSAYAVLRLVTPEYVRSHPRIPLRNLVPMSFTRGRPPSYSEPYAGLSAPGDYSHPIKGFRVSGTCAQQRAVDEELSTGERPDRTQAEVMVVVKSPPGGSIVKAVNIDYTVDGHAMTLPVRWILVNCGPQVADRCR